MAPSSFLSIFVTTLLLLSLLATAQRQSPFLQCIGKCGPAMSRICKGTRLVGTNLITTCADPNWSLNYSRGQIPHIQNIFNLDDVVGCDLFSQKDGKWVDDRKLVCGKGFTKVCSPESVTIETSEAGCVRMKARCQLGADIVDTSIIVDKCVHSDGGVLKACDAARGEAH